jgi:tetratricopeptide (TPR) repeat protein
MTTNKKNNNEEKSNQQASAQSKPTHTENNTGLTLSDDSFNFQETIDSTEQFLETNRKKFAIGIIAIFVVIAGAIAWNNYKEKQDLEASNQMFRAEQYFGEDDFSKALNGDGNYPGFLEITDEYKGTKAANLANYYSGICFLQTGQFDQAISYLNKYDAEDDITEAVALGAIGDAYSEQGKYNDAATYYQKAADKKLQNFSPVYLMKLGLVYEALNQGDKAVATYKLVKMDYSDSQQARTIDEFIARVQNK